MLTNPQIEIYNTIKERVLFLSGIGCFSPDTLVRTKNGLVKISLIKKGDYVLSFNLQTKNPEYKLVVNKYAYHVGEVGQSLITFVFDNYKITSTSNHEYYYRGEWVQASELAERAMETSKGNKRDLLGKQLRTVTDSELVWVEKNNGDETSLRRKRVFQNNADRKWQIENNKITQIGCNRVDSKPKQQTSSESQRFRQSKQQYRKFGMGHSFRKHKTWVSFWECVYNACKGFGSKMLKIKRSRNTNYKTNDIERQKHEQHCKNAQSNLQYNSRYTSWDNLEAREIDLSKILHIEINTECEVVYDLCIEDNHNYCITHDNIIVHNSGKTYIAGILSLKYITKFPNAIGFIGANTYSQLSKSTLKRFFDVWGVFGIVNGINYVVDKIPPDNWPKIHIKLKSYENTICFDNGCLIFTSSLDNYKMIDGTEFAWAMLDETKDTKEEAVKDVIIGRLRQKALYIKDGIVSRVKTDISFNPLYIFTSPAKVLWLNEWFNLPDYYNEITDKIFSKTEFFHKETERQCIVISSTYHNEMNLPSGYIDGLIADYHGSPHKVDMYIYGSPIAKSGGEFYHQFNRLIHVSETEYEINEPLHISFDFNVKPYITAVVGQILSSDEDDNYHFNIIKEYTLEAPRNNSEDLSNAILTDFFRHKGSVYIYGDSSGKNRQTVSKEFKHNYEVIESVLKPLLNSRSDRVKRRNPPLVKRRDFINKLLANGYDIRMTINSECKELIKDFEFVRESPDGKKLKEKGKDKNGEIVEKLCHVSDAFDYMVCSAFEMYFE